MDDTNYKLGQMEAQVTETRDDVVELKKSIAEMQKDIKEIKNTMITWKSTAVGAVTVIVPVLSGIGAIILWLGDGLIDLIKARLG